MKWIFKTYSELTKDELYRILQLRQEVFTVEQNIVYNDCDNKDQETIHLLGVADGEIISYLRILNPGVKFAEYSIGRVLTQREFRRQGLARISMENAIKYIRENLGGGSIRILAQEYLQDYYKSMGLEPSGEPYIEAGVSHIEMILK